MSDENRIQYLLKLLEQSLECISVAISVELEYADYKRAEDLKVLRRKIERELGLRSDA